MMTKPFRQESERLVKALAFVSLAALAVLLSELQVPWIAIAVGIGGVSIVLAWVAWFLNSRVGQTSIPLSGEQRLFAAGGLYPELAERIALLDIRQPEELALLDKAGLIVFLKSSREDKITLWNTWVDLLPSYTADLQGAFLSGAVLSKANLRGADLSGAFLSGAFLHEADLHWADLHRADLSGAFLFRTDLSGADLRGADLIGAFLFRTDLIGADLSGTFLCGASLSLADLSRADLSGAFLCGASLRGANLRGANLSKANLRGAVLRGTNLSEANLSGANLRGASLREAFLFGTDLSGTKLEGTILPDDTNWSPDVDMGRFTNPGGRDRVEVES